MSMTGQADFAAALLDRTKDIPHGLTSWSGAKPTKRFGIYRNNVKLGLSEALAIRFPATQAIVGKEFFAAMAGAYVMQEPPRSPVLLHYGTSFAEFVACFAPVSELPYLADVVRLENARIEACHAADMLPLPPESLATIDPERLANLKFAFHPSFAVVRSKYPIVTIWAMNSGEVPLASIQNRSGEDALVVRPQSNVLTHRLPSGGALFLEALADGQSLEDAAGAAQGDAPNFDLTANLVGLFRSGAIVAVSDNSD